MVPTGKVLRLGLALLFVIADQADIDGDQKCKNESLNQPDQQLQNIKRNRNPPRKERHHLMQKILPAIHISKKTKRERNGTEENRNHFDQPDKKEDSEKPEEDNERNLGPVRLVSKQIIGDRLETGISDNVVNPRDHRNNCERQ